MKIIFILIQKVEGATVCMLVKYIAYLHMCVCVFIMCAYFYLFDRFG